MKVTYELRSKRGTPIYAFDHEEHARKELNARSVRVPGLRLFKVTRQEEELSV